MFQSRRLRLVPCLLLLAALVVACQASVEDRLAEVRAMHDVGEFRESVEPLREILAESPGHPEASYRLGVALTRTGRAASAVWPLQRASESETFAEPANLALGQLFLSLSDYDRALAAVDRVLALEPANRGALNLRVMINLEAKRQEEVLADLDRLEEATPDDPQTIYTRAVALGELGRVEESETAHRRFLEIADASGDPGLAAKACVALALHFRDYAEDPARAESELHECLDAHPDDPYVVQTVLQMYDETDQRDEALALARRHFEANPGDLGRRMKLANRLRNSGLGDEAEALMKDAVEITGGISERLALARFYRAQGDGEAALAALEEVFAEVGGPKTDEARLLYADALLDAERFDQALEQLREIDDPIYQALVEGRLLVLKHDYANALAKLEPAIAQWPDNSGARYLAGVAALRTGRVEQAVSHLREAVRSDASATDAALALARVYYERGEFFESAKFARAHYRQRAGDVPEGYVMHARTLTEMGDYDKARQVIDDLEERGFAAEVATERAAIARAESGSAAALRVVEKSGLDLTDPANELALRSAAEDLIALGRHGEALARVQAAVDANPDSVPLRTLLGQAQVRSGDVNASAASFEKALALDGDYVPALSGLATAAALRGDVDRAVSLYDRAAALDPDDSSAPYAAAQLVLAAGRTQDAEKRLRALVARQPGAVGARNDLAWLLAEAGRDLDEALTLAEQAAERDPQAPVLDTLGYVHLKRNEANQAVAAFRRSLEADPAASTRYHLGLALSMQGDAQGAAEAFRQALAQGAFPEADAARRELERLARP